VAALRDAEKPVTFKGLAKLVKVKKAEEEVFRAALESAVGGGQVHRWPNRGQSQYFWNVALEVKAREAILTAAATQSLSKPDLSKLAAKGKKLPGFSVKRVESVVSALIAENQLRSVSAFAGNSKLLVLTGGDHKAYFSAARSFVEQRIRTAGFDPAAFFAENLSQHDKLPVAQVDAAGLILDAVRSLEPVRGVPVSTLRLRNHLPVLAKRELDAAALELRKKQQVTLNLHADPHNLSQEDKDLLIDGQDGTYYVAIAIR
jgi:hypothetical protein